MILRSPTEDENGGLSLQSQPQFSKEVTRSTKESLARQSRNQKREEKNFTAENAKNAEILSFILPRIFAGRKECQQCQACVLTYSSDLSIPRFD
jgi:hypothetical protein